MLEDATAGTIAEARPRAKPLVAGLAIPLAACVAAWPLATFVARAIPGLPRLGLLGADALIVAVSFAIGALAGRARRHPLSPLSWILGSTIALVARPISPLGLPLTMPTWD